MMRSVVLVVCSLIATALGHGRLWDPPSRSSTWRFGYDTPKNWNDNELFCGGYTTQHTRNGGKCGVCGDAWDGERQNEAGGKYAKGIITRTFSQGEVIPIDVDITANHRGWFEFKVCPVNNPNVKATQECLDAYPLELADGSGPRWQLTTGRTGHYVIYYRLPAGLTCTQCVLQWHWNTGNTWGTDPDTGRQCVGCGPQENFRGCADIAIQGGTVTGPTDEPTEPTGETTVPTDEPTDPTQPTDELTQPTEPTTKPSTTPNYTRPPPTTRYPPSPTTTPAEPTPSPWPTRIEGVQCRGINDWEGNPRLDAWCLRNCNHFPPFCPQDKCDCWLEELL